MTERATSVPQYRRHDLCWYGNLKESEQIGLVLSEELVVGKIKSRWRRKKSRRK